MLTGKQRSYLKGLANTMDPIFQVGKSGITDNFIKQVDEALEARELIKIKVLNNSLLESKEVALELAEKTKAEFVQSIGSKLVLYRESEENKKIQLP
ncbi:ribosome assembly RNA-binding protein YhbY [Clostridium sp. Cult3]|uniref:ribosome assembly RNA-binding protein YhbY n=1 Tax=Clostridium sp. Cult3 TaxID=2079004 RepID=UPI001F01BC5C|nr:ribosome assembly RNA-binding protein YhbY [Clostridium sp. Cult3]MCF6460608.1 ribosome assembly RNA-binding protein YhbY [Clostridium sp. Cult3]